LQIASTPPSHPDSLESDSTASAKYLARQSVCKLPISNRIVPGKTVTANPSMANSVTGCWTALLQFQGSGPD
jgi:hypothetical protein